MRFNNRSALMNDIYVSVIIVSISVERIRCSTDEHEHHNTIESHARFLQPKIPYLIGKQRVNNKISLRKSLLFPKRVINMDLLHYYQSMDMTIMRLKRVQNASVSLILLSMTDSSTDVKKLTVSRLKFIAKLKMLP